MASFNKDDQNRCGIGAIVYFIEAIFTKDGPQGLDLVIKKIVFML